MIHIINKHNRHLYGCILEDMYRLRHKIFVEQRGWSRLAKIDGLERDEFDTDDAIYLLKLSPDMEILGGMRIYPTTVKTQLNSIFREACVLAAPPSDSRDFELSRYFIVDSKSRSKTGKPVHYELYTGLFEFAVATGIRSVSCFTETSNFVRSARMPWEVQQLGVPMEYGEPGESGGYALPIQIMIEEKMLAKTKRMWRMDKPVMSLSLGDKTPYAEVGFKSRVVLQVLDFIEQHPEHISVLAALAQLFLETDSDVLEQVHQFVETVSEQEALDGFDASLTARSTHACYNVSAQ